MIYECGIWCEALGRLLPPDVSLWGGMEESQIHLLELRHRIDHEVICPTVPQLHPQALEFRKQKVIHESSYYYYSLSHLWCVDDEPMRKVAPNNLNHLEPRVVDMTGVMGPRSSLPRLHVAWERDVDFTRS